MVNFGLAEEERVLTIQNFVDFMAPTEVDRAIYVPFNTVTASE